MTKTEAKLAMERHAKVIAGSGGDRETGFIHEITGDIAIVGWDSGVRTTCPLSDLALKT
jgi:hypothetical protein